MLHLGAECASDPDRNLVLLAIADIGDVRIMLVDAAISEQAGIITRRMEICTPFLATVKSG
jgi:hypothetical protein